MDKSKEHSKIPYQNVVYKTSQFTSSFTTLLMREYYSHYFIVMGLNMLFRGTYLVSFKKLLIYP